MKETTVPENRETAIAETREAGRVLLPAVDIFEAPDGLAVVADLPGIDKNGLDVHVEDSVLTISGRVKPDTNGNTVYREFELLNYYRQFQLGEQVDQEKIKAEMKHGVLTIHLPKAEKAKPKKITVNVAS